MRRPQKGRSASAVPEREAEFQLRRNFPLPGGAIESAAASRIRLLPAGKRDTEEESPDVAPLPSCVRTHEVLPGPAVAPAAGDLARRAAGADLSAAGRGQGRLPEAAGSAE